MKRFLGYIAGISYILLICIIVAYIRQKFNINTEAGMAGIITVSIFLATLIIGILVVIAGLIWEFIKSVFNGKQ